MTQLVGTHVLLTGAASGIGRALALDLAREVDRLTLLDNWVPGLEEVAAACRAEGATVQSFCVDVSRELDPEITDLPTPDVVIANAGVGGNNPGYAFDVAIHRKITGINFFGVVHTLAPFLQGMVNRGHGHLVAVSSIASIRGLPMGASYCSSKAAVKTFMDSLRADLAGSGIRVTTVLPGYVWTPMTEQTFGDRPFEVSASEAAREILDAIRRNRTTYVFPWVMRALTFFQALLPDRLHDWVVGLFQDRGKGPEAEINRRACLFTTEPNREP